MEFQHECFKFRGWWIVKSSHDDMSLQIKYNRKPLLRQLKEDYKLLDNKLLLAMQVQTEGVAEVIKMLEEEHEVASNPLADSSTDSETPE